MAMMVFVAMTRTEIAYGDPVATFSTYADQPYSVFLDSALVDPIYGRYSYIAVNPSAIVTDHPFERMEEVAAESPGGLWLGYLGYELYHYSEAVPVHPGQLPECWMGYFETVCVYDNFEKRAWRMGAAADGRGSITDAGGRELHPLPPASRDSYLDNVLRVKKYLQAGDCYQVNLSQEFSSPAGGESPWNTYLKLRKICPTPYAAYLNCGNFQVVSASPECFLKMEAGRVLTRPIKGTRRRGKNPQEDAALREELVVSPKDRAELLMIIDLERNDLGRVCRPGSVQVADLGVIESFANVHHLVATVEGQLKNGVRPLDVIRAIFPGGSITGAPKVRALEIIHELESGPRGVYTGTIGWIGPKAAYLNIAIRTMVIQDGVATYRAGGGIVIDSDPEEEYRELMTKGESLREALELKP